MQNFHRYRKTGLKIDDEEGLFHDVIIHMTRIRCKAGAWLARIGLNAKARMYTNRRGICVLCGLGRTVTAMMSILRRKSLGELT